MSGEVEFLPGLHPYGLLSELEGLTTIGRSMSVIQFERQTMLAGSAATTFRFSLRLFIQDAIATQADQSKSALKLLENIQKLVVLIAAVRHDDFRLWVTQIQFLDLHRWPVSYLYSPC